MHNISSGLFTGEWQLNEVMKEDVYQLIFLILQMALADTIRKQK